MEKLITIFENNPDNAFIIGKEDLDNKTYFKRNKYNPINMYNDNNVMFAPFSDFSNLRVPVHSIGISLSVLELIKDNCDKVIIELTTVKQDGSKEITFLEGDIKLWIDSRFSNVLNKKKTNSNHKEMNNLKNDFQKMVALSSLKEIVEI